MKLEIEYSLLPQSNHSKIKDELTIDNLQPSCRSSMEQIWWQDKVKTPEQMLWINVLILFIKDTQKDYNKYQESTNGNSKKFYSNVLNNLETVKTEWIEEMCEYSDIDYSKFKKLIESICDGTKKIKVPKKGRWF